MCVDTAEDWVLNDGTCVCVEKYTCWSYCLIGIVGLAMVIMSTYGADWIPWADSLEIVAVSMHEGYEKFYVDRENNVYQGWTTPLQTRATWFKKTFWGPHLCIRLWMREREHWKLRNLILIITFNFFWASYYYDYLEAFMYFSFTPWLLVYLCRRIPCIAREGDSDY